MNLTGQPVQPKAQREGPDPDHMARVGQLPCCICYEYGLPQLTRTQVHHSYTGAIRPGGHRTA